MFSRLSKNIQTVNWQGQPFQRKWSLPKVGSCGSYVNGTAPHDQPHGPWAWKSSWKIRTPKTQNQAKNLRHEPQTTSSAPPGTRHILDPQKPTTNHRTFCKESRPFRHPSGLEKSPKVFKKRPLLTKGRCPHVGNLVKTTVLYPSEHPTKKVGGDNQTCFALPCHWVIYPGITSGVQPFFRWLVLNGFRNSSFSLVVVFNWDVSRFFIHWFSLLNSATSCFLLKPATFLAFSHRATSWSPSRNLGGWWDQRHTKTEDWKEVCRGLTKENHDNNISCMQKIL